MKRGTPYKATFQDKFGNVQFRNVAQPQCASRYFRYANSIDVHNQMRQKVLGLEEKWKTTDCWLRVWTTLIGMTVTDLYFLRRAEK